ncbi:MAG: hypothetical protein A2Z16_12250 [Chloroflexi bacterium RBG_16_54_18]|nr:MAG: hypothetical protein A2Z16_12250 [Chloroflexi bacterium RBG_16_54_18]
MVSSFQSAECNPLDDPRLDLFPPAANQVTILDHACGIQIFQQLGERLVVPTPAERLAEVLVRADHRISKSLGLGNPGYELALRPVIAQQYFSLAGDKIDSSLLKLDWASE